MARVKEFNEAEALDRAVQLFWKKGFTDTSMDDLVNETGVSRYGIYGTFGNKQEFFRAVLSRYWELITHKLQSELRKPDASLPEIKAYFGKLLKIASAERGLGCLVCNTATEVTPHDEDARKAVHAFFDDLSGAFKSALENARAKGEVAKTLDIEATATYLTGVLQGTSVMARAQWGKQRIDQFIKIALKTLD